MKRGEVWWADLGKPQGSAPGYRRPVVVVSSDTFNDSGISTVVVVVVTSNARLAAAPGNVAVSASESGLPKDSVINVSQILTVDKGVLCDRVGHLASPRFHDVERGLRKVMGL